MHMTLGSILNTHTHTPTHKNVIYEPGMIVQKPNEKSSWGKTLRYANQAKGTGTTIKKTGQPPRVFKLQKGTIQRHCKNNSPEKRNTNQEIRLLK